MATVENEVKHGACGTAQVTRWWRAQAQPPAADWVHKVQGHSSPVTSAINSASPGLQSKSQRLGVIPLVLF